MPLGNAFGWPTLIVLLFIVLLLFGAPKLPGLAKSVAESMKIFRKEIKGDDAKSAPGAEGAAADAESTEQKPEPPAAK